MSFLCNLCHKILKHPSSLERHRLCHTGYRPYQCDVCNKTFARSEHLLKHKLIHSGAKPFKCETCNECFRYRHYLTKHSLRHIDELTDVNSKMNEPNSCSEINLVRNSSEARKTSVDVNVPKSHSTLCQNNCSTVRTDKKFCVFNKQNSDSSTKKVNKNNATFPEKTNKTNDLSYGGLKIHPNSVLSANKRTDNVFKRCSELHKKNALSTESISKGTGVSRSCLKFVDNSFSSEDSQIKYMDVPKTELCRGIARSAKRDSKKHPAASNLCSKTPFHCGVEGSKKVPLQINGFRDQDFKKCDILATHQHNNAGGSEKSKQSLSRQSLHKCQLCEKEFRYLGSLTRHIRYVHLRLKPHRCSICYRKYSRLEHLRNHQVMHSGDKPHKCTVCDKSYRYPHTLTKHFKARHTNFENIKQEGHKSREIGTA